MKKETELDILNRLERLESRVTALADKKEPSIQVIGEHMSDTTRTDEEINFRGLRIAEHDYVPAAFARQLERELRDTKATADLRGLMLDTKTDDA
jgi:hypothetical protein